MPESNTARSLDPSALADPLGTAGGASGQDEMLVRVGHMTRLLHDNLRGLGFDKLIAKAAHDIPDARDRLDYVAKMTEQAAQRVLNATEAATPMQNQIEAGAGSLKQDWQVLLQEGCTEAQMRAMAERTLTYLDDTRRDASATKQQLLDIMMAQDFQDLTGQVIRKVTDLAHGIEQQLVQLLVDYAPPEVRRDVGAGLLNGPQIKPNNSPDVVSNQSQVDDLLDSLGF